MTSDLKQLWQKNREVGIFLLANALIFLVAQILIGIGYGEDYERARVRMDRLRRELEKPMAIDSNLNSVEKTHVSLKHQLGSLVGRSQFVVRPEFQLSNEGFSAENQYFDRITRTREDLLRRAFHLHVEIPDTLGLPSVSPTGKEELSRYLRGLDLVHRLIHASMDFGVVQVEDIRIEPLRANSSRQGPLLEEVRVSLRILAPGRALHSWIEWTQAVEQSLPMIRAKLSPSRQEDLILGEFEFLAIQFLEEEIKS